MEIYSPTLFIEINNSEYIFAVGDESEQENFNLIYKFTGLNLKEIVMLALGSYRGKYIEKQYWAKMR